MLKNVQKEGRSCQEAEAQMKSRTSRSTTTRAVTATELAGRSSVSLPHNVRAMIVDGKHGVGRAAEVLGVDQKTGCDIVRPQETVKRRSGQSAAMNPEATGEGEKRGQRGVELAVRKIISGAEVRSPEFISDRLRNVTLGLCGRARAVTFII